jgi:hypothetical protein
MASRTVAGGRRLRSPLPFLLPLLLSISPPVPTHAFRYYLSFAPNAALVPCPPENPAGCHSTGLCEAWGHADCFPLSDEGGSGEDDDRRRRRRRLSSSSSSSSNNGTTAALPRSLGGRGGSDDDGDGVRGITTAGSALKVALAGAKGGWDIRTCSGDSDGDGLTDGDELGDGCCSWPTLPPMTTDDISNPSFVSSATSRASCTKGGLPPAPSGLAITSCGTGCARLTWSAVPDLTAACVCENVLAVTVNGAAQPMTLGVPRSPSSFNLCGLPSGATVAASVVALNRAGPSPASNVATGTAGSSGPAISCSSAFPSSPYVMDATARATKDSFLDRSVPGWAGFYVLLAVGLAVSLVAFAATCGRDPTSLLRRVFVHRYVHVGKVAGQEEEKGAAPSSSSSSSRLPFADLGAYSVGYSAAIVAATLALAGCAAVTYVYFDALIYPLGTKAAVGRGLGYALAASMGLQLLPAARNSVWKGILGVPFERAIKFHTYLGGVTLVLTLLHFVLILVPFADSKLGIQYVFTWQTRDGINPLAGVIAGACIVVLTVLALEPIRRKLYELFLLGHVLWIPAFVLTLLHMKKSDASLVPVFLPPVVLAAIDFALLALDLYFVRESVLVDAGLVYADGTVLSCSAASRGEPMPPSGSKPSCAFLVIDKLPGGIGGDFKYAVGQYVCVSIPSVSHLPHPISISSVPDPRTPGRFTLHIRSMGEGTWSAKVGAAVLAAIGRCHDDFIMSAVRGGGRAPAAVGGAGAVGDSATAIAPAPTVLRSASAPPPYAIDGAGAYLPSFIARLSSAQVDLVRTAGLSSLGRVHVAGPFGFPSLQFEEYSHFVLVAGGIGITPIAPLHYALAAGQVVADPPSFLGLVSRGLGKGRGVAPLKTLTTIWTEREGGLFRAFAPLLPEATEATTGWAKVLAYCTARGAAATRFSTPTPFEGGGAGRGGTGYGDGDPSPHETQSGKKGGDASPPAADGLPWPLRTGRPDLPVLFRAAAEAARAAEAQAAGGSVAGVPTVIRVAVAACGPAPLIASALATAAAMSEYRSPQAPEVRFRFDVHKETFLM